VSNGRETGRSYDSVAGDYAAEIGNELTGKPFDRGLLDAFAELVGSGTVADVGCGPGHIGAYLTLRGVHAVGLDLSPEMCAIASRTTPLHTCAADMTAIPLGSGVLSGLVCMYAVIHLDVPQRAAAYREFARVLDDGGHALVAFHTSDAEHRTGETQRVSEWWGHEVDLTFRFLDADEEVSALDTAGLQLVARLDRSPHAGLEHESQRSYLVVRLVPGSASR
jgi:SAM-dependent methyltransferase